MPTSDPHHRHRDTQTRPATPTAAGFGERSHWENSLSTWLITWLGRRVVLKAARGSAVVISSPLVAMAYITGSDLIARDFSKGS